MGATSKKRTRKSGGAARSKPARKARTRASKSPSPAKSKRGSASPPKSRRTRGAPAATNEGQRRLLEVPGSLAEIAKRLGCSKATVGNWRAGRKLPSEVKRLRLREVLEIPVRAWDLAPGAAPASPEPSRARTSGPGPEPPLCSACSMPLDTLALTRDRLARIHRDLQREDLSFAQRSKKEDLEAKLLALKARLERDEELRDDRIVREHPEWVRICEVMLEALEPWPDAASAAAEAIERIAEG